MSNSIRIYISYCWEDKSVADEIDKHFFSLGIPLIRDERDILYKNSIKEFMQGIRRTDFVLMIISNSFLRSSNCMFEVLEMVKEPDFKRKLLQVRLEDADIFNPLGKLDYIKYWESKYIELQSGISEIEKTNSISLLQDLKHYQNIQSTIGEFIGIIAEENCISYEKLKKDNFKQITDYIEFPVLENENRPKIIDAKIHKFFIESEPWVMFIGMLNDKPYEIYCMEQKNLFLDRYMLDSSSDIRLIKNVSEKGRIRIDLSFLDQTDGYRITMEGLSRNFQSKEIHIYLKMINSLLQADVSFPIVSMLIDEMVTQEFPNPFDWKDSVKNILATYFSKN